MMVTNAFKPPWWLKNAHIQTLFPFLMRSLTAPTRRRECLELPDDDFLELIWTDAGLSKDAPLVVLLHGLGGTANSKYIIAQQLRYQQLGWRSVVMQFRGAAAPNRKLRGYHSGDTADFNYFLHWLSEREPHTHKMAVGFSLGGNVLLKWLGEQKEQNLVQVAAAVSVPFQLNLVADRVNVGVSRLYRKYLLRGLRRHFTQKLVRNPNPELVQTLDACHCFWTFDEHITAPLHGFDSVHTYYHEASSKAYLRHIATPTLVIHALDDPFMSPQAVPHVSDLSDSITLELSQHGGHVGFVTSSKLGMPKFWLDTRIAEFFSFHMD